MLKNGKKSKLASPDIEFYVLIGVWYCLWSVALNVKTDATQIWVVAGVDKLRGLLVTKMEANHCLIASV